MLLNFSKPLMPESLSNVVKWEFNTSQQPTAVAGRSTLSAILAGIASIHPILFTKSYFGQYIDAIGYGIGGSVGHCGCCTIMVLPCSECDSGDHVMNMNCYEVHYRNKLQNYINVSENVRGCFDTLSLNHVSCKLIVVPWAYRAYNTK